MSTLIAQGEYAIQLITTVTDNTCGNSLEQLVYYKTQNFQQEYGQQQIDKKVMKQVGVMHNTKPQQNN